MANIQKRVNSKGETSYRVQVRLKGYPPQTATFKRLTDAKKWVQDTESAIRDGRHFKTNEAKRHTMAETIDKYIRDILPVKGSDAKQQANQKNQLLEWRERLGHYVLADVTPALLGDMRDDMLRTEVRGNKTRSPSTVNRYMAILSHVFTMAVTEWGWLDDSPMRKVKKPTEPKGRTRFLSDEERVALLAAAKEVHSRFLYPIIVLALSTGARRGEIINLKWSNVSLERKVITLYKTKNKEIRLLPLAGHALELVQQLYAERDSVSDYLFPSPRNPRKPWDMQAPWNKAVEKAALEDFRFHDLRHSAASYLAMHGASPNEIAEVLGHKTLQMVKRYAHLSEAHTSAVVAKMNEGIFS